MSALSVLVAGSLTLAGPASALAALPCDPAGVRPTDGNAAGHASPQLTGRMRGGLTAYRISCARVIVDTVRSRGLPMRAAQIALTTVIVESTMDNLDGGDGTSVGLFQQTVSSYPNINRNDPIAATNAFLNEMLRIYGDGSWATRPVGQVCQAVQRSAFPDRYEPQAHDGGLLADAVWSGTSNIAVYRGSTATFHIRKLDGSGLLAQIPFGASGDLPAVGRYENSPYDNLAVYRPSDASFYIRPANGGTTIRIPFGNPGDLPAPGHYENSPYDNLAVYRPSDASFYIRPANGGTTIRIPFGQRGDIPAIGRYENTPYDNLAIYRPSDASFYIRPANGGTTIRIPFGASGDLPAPGYYEGLPYTNIAVYRPTTNTFHIRRANNTTQAVVFGDGSLGDRPAPGKFQ
ncbi:hypothetical protein O7626_28520 [Micromonospora sp. WMMD1102]|uniref:hypothetical protein n=1 Tax=Micromonospora sp. WMMD1102 TaxID=3016105 RepID=UPI0024156CA6|nr:hypothetical protein [Micromonospora sp. WMMD1102]MDG4789824.1 hypothetical protein [Micromonospora sp. WMMD1102]